MWKEAREWGKKTLSPQQIYPFCIMIGTINQPTNDIIDLTMTEDIRAQHQRPIFISYARKDGREIAAQLRADLQALGFKIWQDVVAMQGGSDWWLQIKEAIEGSVVMILLLTEASVASGVVHDEWSYARTIGTHVIPVTYDDTIFKITPQWISRVDVPILARQHPDFDNTWPRHCRHLSAVVGTSGQ